MFKFLKEKLRQSVSIFSKKIDESGDDELIEEKLPDQPEEKFQKPVEQEIKKEEKQKPSQITPPSKIAEPEVKEQLAAAEPKPVVQKPETKVSVTVSPAAKTEEAKAKDIATSESRTQKEEQEQPHQKKEGFFKKLFKKKEEYKQPEEKPIEKPLAEKKPEQKKELAEPKTLPKEKRAPKKEKEYVPEKQEQKADEEEKQDIIEALPESEETSFESLVKDEHLAEEKTVAAEKESAEAAVEDREKIFDEIFEPETPSAEESQVEERSVPEEKKDVPEEKKKGFFEKLTERVVAKKINSEKFEDMFFEFEVVLLENNVAVEVIEKIKEDLRKSIVDRPIRRNKIEETIIASLTESINDVLSSPSIDIFEKMKNKKPFVICFVGINGSGKTTTIAKVAKMLLDKNKKVVLAAADTFRAAAIDQLQIHADNLNVKMIKHDYGSDPAAVAFDAVKYAEAKGADAVLIDTAGRLHSNTNLVDEMKKIMRVAKPDMKIFVGEAITGNDCIEQASKFNEAIGIDGIILSKADIDEKGGASISVSYVTKKPILFLGTGQEYSDIKPFDKDEIIGSLGLET